MCITYISIHSGCGCPIDSLFEPCDRAMYGNCGVPTQKITQDFAYDDDDDDPKARICSDCLKELKESVRKLFERFRLDGVKVVSRVGDQVYSVGENAWSLDCD